MAVLTYADLSGFGDVMSALSAAITVTYGSGLTCMAIADGLGGFTDLGPTPFTFTGSDLASNSVPSPCQKATILDSDVYFSTAASVLGNLVEASAWSIQVLFKATTNAGPSTYTPFSIGHATLLGRVSLNIDPSNGNGSVVVKDNAGTTHTISLATTFATSLTWYLVTITHAAGVYTAYVGGTLDSTTTTTHGTLTLNRTRIGDLVAADASTGGQPFNDSFGYVATWSRALSAAEVLAIDASIVVWTIVNGGGGDFTTWATCAAAAACTFHSGLSISSTGYIGVMTTSISWLVGTTGTSTLTSATTHAGVAGVASSVSNCSTLPPNIVGMEFIGTFTPSISGKTIDKCLWTTGTTSATLAPTLPNATAGGTTRTGTIKNSISIGRAMTIKQTQTSAFTMTSTPTLYNNTIYAPVGSVALTLIGTCSAGTINMVPVLKNNALLGGVLGLLFVNDATGTGTTNLDPTAVAYNAVTGPIPSFGLGTGNATACGAGNLSGCGYGDNFVSTTNLTLTRLSRLRDAGTSGGSIPTTDAVAVARPQGTAYDIGALEYVPSGLGDTTASGPFWVRQLDLSASAKS